MCETTCMSTVAFSAFTMVPRGYLTSSLLILAVSSNALTIKIGVVFLYGPDVGFVNSTWSFERTASSISLALEDYQQRTGHLTEHTFRMLITHGACFPNIMKRVFNMYFTEKPDVLFGLPCSFDVLHLGLYLSNWKLALFSQGTTDAAFSDKSIYSTLVRIFPSSEKLGSAYTLIFREYGWKRAAMITSLGFCGLSSLRIYTELKASGVTITEWIRPQQYGSEEFVLEQYADQIHERARVIIICMDTPSDLLGFLRIAHRKGMRAPHFVILNYGYDSIDKYTQRPWIREPELNKDLVKEWKTILVEINYKQVRTAGLKGQKFEDFYDLVPLRFTQPPWNYNMSLEKGWRGSPQAVNIYEAALTYFTVLNEILTEGGDYRDGDLLREKVQNRVIHGLRGKILFDDKADREPDYWLLDFQPDWDRYWEVVTIIVAEEEGKRFAPIDDQSLLWGTVGNLPPPDTPVCGFKNELCMEDTSGNLLLIVGVAVSGVIILVIIVLIVLMYRRQKEEEALQQTVWRVDFSEIRIGKARAGSVANMSQKSLHSNSSVEENGGVRQMFTEVGTYKGNMVAILRVYKSRVDLTKADMKELKAMKDMSHNNLAMFVGACIEPPNICYIMAYYTKGSLQDIIENEIIGLEWMFKTSLLSDLANDIIENEIIGLEWMFKTSLLSDLANGMAYLHKSELHSHGSLKSTCCLVDSRWQLKVSSYGLHAFRTGQDETDIGEYEKYRKLLWTAPELLRVPRNDWPRYGTQAADVYSFGLIAQEVIYRAPPYFLEVQSPKDFISTLVRVDHQPHRPELPNPAGDTPQTAISLIEDCWVEDPTVRPTFDNIIKKIRIINKGRKVDIMASLIHKLEKYANNLEDIVNQRTLELIVEKERTDNLLESMLPPSVVEELKHGRTVDAELFEAVTIFFSDIVGFTALSLESSPIDVVNLLNDLYNLFDDIISLHDVYKVETIGDSYMVVSGLPRRNGDNHVAEIANLALDLMSAALDFKIRHCPGLELKLRIGFHTGPCAAGVVGLSMPRYCLFGDTVNMASRMETNGKALMIHMSRYAFAALEKLEGYEIKPRGEMQIKGKGLQMTYWLLGKDGFNKPLPPFDE